MAKITLTRIDNRLIHGQVAVGFIGKSNADRIIVIDDKTAANEFARDVLSIAVPPGLSHSVYSVDEAAKEWRKDQFGLGCVMVIISDILQAYEVYKAGFCFESLMIGGTPTAADRVKFEAAAISFTADEAKMLDELADKGVKIIIQQTHLTKITSWADARKRLRF